MNLNLTEVDLNKNIIPKYFGNITHEALYTGQSVTEICRRVADDSLVP